ncbi:hypothetical protein LSTR_LSTR005227 [Laodelphax striatellus]|nr:hypothetical protein LSTR_LSTR005227 [Laodelphax striatellus]
MNISCAGKIAIVNREKNKRRRQHRIRGRAIEAGLLSLYMTVKSGLYTQGMYLSGGRVLLEVGQGYLAIVRCYRRDRERRQHTNSSKVCRKTGACFVVVVLWLLQRVSAKPCSAHPDVVYRTAKFMF